MVLDYIPGTDHRGYVAWVEKGGLDHIPGTDHDGYVGCTNCGIMIAFSLINRKMKYKIHSVKVA